MKYITLSAIAGFTVLACATTVQAADCTNAKDRWELDGAEVSALYDCIEATMAAQYRQSGHELAGAYRDWQVTATRPALAGPHGERYLLTFANDIAAPQYLMFEEEDVTMPVGSVLAKESFILKDGKAQVGPLFLMTKLEAGAAPDAQDWFYEAIGGNGKTMNISQKFCADCHLGWDYRDSLAYPLEDVRLQN